MEDNDSLRGSNYMKKNSSSNIINQERNSNYDYKSPGESTPQKTSKASYNQSDYEHPIRLTEAEPDEEIELPPQAITLEKCYFCDVSNREIYTFSKCEHKICIICLYREIFLHHLPDFSEDKESISIICNCKKGYMEINVDDILVLLSKKAEDDKTKAEVHENKKCDKNCSCDMDLYCVNCRQNVCPNCVKQNDNAHFNHRLVSNDKMVKTISESLNEIPMKFQCKETFEANFSNICEQLRENFEKNLNSSLSKIDDLIKSVFDFRRQFEESYKNSLIKSVKKLKIMKIFYLNYYYERNIIETSNKKDVNLLVFLNEINRELLGIKLSQTVKLDQKLNDIKTKIDDMKKATKERKLLDFEFSEIPTGFKNQDIITNIHNDSNISLIQAKNEKILTASADFTIKIWEENEEDTSFSNTVTIDKMTGAVICLYELLDGRIATSSRNDNILKIWKWIDKSLSLDLTLSAHSKPIICISQICDNRLITGAGDNFIFIWNCGEDMNFKVSQRISNENTISSLIALKDKTIVSGDIKGIIRIWKEQKGTSIQGNPGQASGPANEANNQGSEENISFVMVQTIREYHKRVIRTLCELDNCGFASAGNEGHITVFSQNKGNFCKCGSRLVKHIGPVTKLLQLFDGRIASASGDHCIILWKKGHKGVYEANEIIKEYEHAIFCMIQLTDGRLCYITSDKKMFLSRNRLGLY